jgi:WD40 repeat protein/energy-coupling factor transporter ATP-binding protein EcfA2
MSSATDLVHGNPFPGLRPFNDDEVHLFFGRENQIDAMVDKLATTRFLAVVGTSGSGKSSLVNCGLRPALSGGLLASAGTAWRIAQFRPGSDPLGNMAFTLAKDALLFSDYEAGEVSLPDIINTNLRMSKRGLIDIVKQARMEQGTNLLLVVDQFEELFRYRQSGTDDKEKYTDSNEQATAFVNLLLEAATQKTVPIYVVLTMRSDFLGDCTKLPGLAEAINAGQYLVPRMSRDERRAAIKGPVSVADGEISPLLLTRLVNDVGDNPDQLSILQHALNRTWAYWQHEGRDDAALALTHYEAIGSMVHALDQHAHKAYGELVSERQRQICEKIFKSLTDKATDPRGIRRPTPMGILCELTKATLEEVAEVLEVFRQPSRSFLMPPAGEVLYEHTIIDISHESLMRVWQRLNSWADEEASSAQKYQRLSVTAALYETGQAALWRDPELQLALDWREQTQPNETWAARYHLGFVNGMNFLQSSRDARDAEVDEREAQRQRELQTEQEKTQTKAKYARRMGRLASIIGVLAVGASIFGVVALNASQQAKQAQQAAQQSLSMMHASFSKQETKKGNATLGTLLALLALPNASIKPLPEVHSALYAALNVLGEQIIIEGHLEPVSSANFSPDGNQVVTGSWDYTARIWDVASGKERKVLTGHTKEVVSVNFNPDGEQIVTASWDKTARIWDVASGQALAVLQGHEKQVYSANFSPDGNQVVTASLDDTARIWNVASGEELTVLRGHVDSVGSANFSPDGKQVVTASLDDTARIWDVASGTELAVFTGHTEEVTSANFSPDGKQIVTASEDSTARIWDVANGKEMTVITGHENTVTSANFSPDGKQIVTASWDKTLRIWDVVSGIELAVLTGHENTVSSANFSPDGKQIVTTSWDKTVRIWSKPSSVELAVLTGHENTVTSANFSPDGKQIVTASEDSTVRIWDVANGQVLAVLQGHENIVTSANFSPDGKQIVTASEDFTAQIWDVANGQALAVLQGHENAVTSANFSPDGKQVVTASFDLTARIWNVASGQELAVLKGHENAVTSANFSPDGKQVVTASFDLTARIWNVASGKELTLLTGHYRQVYSAKFSPNGKQVVTASFDDTARIWDVASGKELTVLTGHENTVFSAHFSPDGNQIVTASEDMTTRIWDVVSGIELAVLTGHENAVHSANFSPDGNQVVTASKDNTARIWDNLSIEELIERAKKRLPRQELTKAEKKEFFVPNN